MAKRPTDLAIPFPVPAALAAEAPECMTPLEKETVELFDEFRLRLLRYVFTFGLPAHDAEEIVQEVFLALFVHLRNGRSRQNLRGWIFRVAHNLALKQRQANHKAQRRTEPDEQVAAMVTDPAPNPEEELASSQQAEKYRAILRALPHQDQCCLYLRAEGLRYREIGEVMGMSLGAVAMSLTKSLERFRRAEKQG